MFWSLSFFFYIKVTTHLVRRRKFAGSLFIQLSQEFYEEMGVGEGAGDAWEKQLPKFVKQTGYELTNVLLDQ